MKEGDNLTVFDIDGNLVTLVDDDGHKYQLELDSPDQAVFQLCFDDHDSFYKLDQSKLAELAEKPLDEMADFVVENGQPTSVSSDHDVGFTIVADASLVDDYEERQLREELRGES